MPEHDTAARLLAAAVGGEGELGAAKAAYEITGLGVSIVDPLYRPIAFYAPGIDEKDCERKDDDNPVSRKRWMELMRQSDEPRIDSEGGTPYRAMCIDARSGGKSLAKVTFFELRPFREEDKAVLKLLAQVIACIRQGKTDKETGEREELSNLLAGLVRGEIDENEVADILRYFQAQMDARLRVIVLQEKDEGKEEYNLIQLRMTQVFRAITVQMEDCVVCLMEDEAWRQAEQMKETARYFQLFVGVSRDFSGLRHARAYYLQAEFAMRQARKTRRDIVRYDECMLEDVIAHCRKERKLTTYCRPEILRLMEYDAQNETDYAGTFRCYCENLCNMAQTARTSFLHYNTIKYRLKMVESITGISAVSARDLCEFLLTYEMIEAQNI